MEMPGGGWRLTGPTKYASFVDIVGFVGRARRQPPPGKCEHNIKTRLLITCTSLELPGGGWRLTGPTKYASFVDIVGFVGRARRQPPPGISEHNI